MGTLQILFVFNLTLASENKNKTQKIDNESFHKTSGKATKKRKFAQRPFKYTSRRPPALIWRAFFMRLFQEEFLKREKEVLQIALLASSGKGKFPEKNQKEDGKLSETGRVISLVRSNWNQVRDGEETGEEDGEQDGKGFNLLKAPKMGEEARAYLDMAMNKVRGKLLSKAEKFCNRAEKMTLTPRILVSQLCLTNGMEGAAKLLELALPAKEEVIQYYESRPKREQPAAFIAARKARKEARTAQMKLRNENGS